MKRNRGNPMVQWRIGKFFRKNLTINLCFFFGTLNCEQFFDSLRD